MHVVLAIAGSDSSGCAGIQADIRAITASGGHAATVVTSITAQSSLRLLGFYPIPGREVRRQLDAVLGDLPVKAVKSGVLGSVEAVEAVAEALQGLGLPYVLDPVMATTAGAELAGAAVISAMHRRLFPLATLLTPNAPEAAALTGMPVRDRDEAVRAGTELLATGCRAVLVKGGHLPADPFVDVLVERSGHTVFEGTALSSPNTRGTGCTLASTIATHLARGMPLRAAVERGRLHLTSAIHGGYPLPGGGPVDAFAPYRQASGVWPLCPPEVAHV
ncbi:MAG: bifunctional hydroxymethylpyrimidine kinase/phosphomethylpyrimidine kinase [Dehalococcoidia bacterium]|nr:bifunctional hydroxymethylpyrimidine kinase/phosphomethylpyrimidine kinase [Dehalococcoidia bacterium]